MKKIEKDTKDYFDGILRNKWWMFGASTIVLAFALTIAFALPPVFKSSATILIEQQEIPQEFVRTTVTGFADQRIQIISQRAMTRQNLLSIIEKYNLYAEDRIKDPIEEIVAVMREDIDVDMVSAQMVDPRSGRPTVATIAFTVAYKNDSPVLAQKVANELVSLYLSENIKARRKMASQTLDFLSDESSKLAVRIADLENKLAEFKKINRNKLPELVGLNTTMLDRTEGDLIDVERDQQQLKERRMLLETQLSMMNPYSLGDERDMDPRKMLQSLQTQFISNAALYADDHPDMTRLRKQIAALETQVGDTRNVTSLVYKKKLLQQELKLKRQDYTLDHPDIKAIKKNIKSIDVALENSHDEAQTSGSTDADNPLYLRVSTQLLSIDEESKRLDERARDLRMKLVLYEQRLTDTPDVEKEYRTLVRDYDNAWSKYQELKSKQMEAKLAESLEQERKGERFTLIEPPMQPIRPDSPNRIMILIAGALFSILIGLAIAFIRDALDGRIYGSRQVEKLLEMAPLGVIPMIETRRDKVRRYTVRSITVLGILGGFSALLVGVNEFYKPLDVVWFVAMRRLDIM